MPRRHRMRLATRTSDDGGTVGRAALFWDDRRRGLERLSDEEASPEGQQAGAGRRWRSQALAEKLRPKLSATSATTFLSAFRPLVICQLLLRAFFWAI